MENRQGEVTVREALQNNERRFRALVTATWDVVYSMSPDWSEMRELCGKGFLADMKAPSRDWLQKYVYRDDQPHVVSLIEQAIRTKSILEIENRVLLADGSLGWTFSRAVPLLDDKGEIVEWFGAASDITERKRMEDALRDSEARFRAFIDNSPAIAWMKDAQGRYVYMSRAFESRLRLRLEDCRNKTDAEIFSPEVAEKFRFHDLKALAANSPIQVVEDAPDGSTWIVTKFPFPTLSGERFVGGVGVDISERERAEQELRESEERLRILGDNLPNCVVYQYSHDADGIPHILYVSAGVERLNGIKAGDMIKDATAFFRQIYPEHLIPAWFEDVKTSARDLSVFEREVQIRLPSGELRWMHLLSRPRLLPDGGIIWDGVETDITERKRAQEVLLRSEKLAATGRMAATIAHEVNNPLAAAMNAVYLARTNLANANQTSEMLELAEQELRRAAHITQQTLGFYRESGGLEQVTLPNLVHEVLSVYATKLQNRKISVQCRFSCNLGSRRDGCPEKCEQCAGCLFVHAGELRQIISNLLANGIDALSDGGVMHIRVLRLSDRVQLTIADDGHGIRTEHLKRIFEPFFTTKETTGTGLGLWVTQELVRKHNGIISVRSRRDKGTVFRLTFPQATDVERNASPAASIA
ncbi:MAG TPA: PAS domain-containing protein [Candidatus Acidoferrales bacterium]|nr:PAS domain-containing protein [Candidatus Acidoferrales bacterium]